MSPAPQGNPEVEKYIGSYLISQRVPGVKTSPNKRFPQQKSVETEKIRYNKYCYPPRDARYPVPPLQGPMPVDYTGNNHYKHPGGWAGVPLISMTSGNPRRNKKIPSNGPQKFHQKHPQQFTKEGEDSRVESDRSPLTRLAIHTQGAPLIQAGRYNGRCRNYNREQNRGFKGDCNRWDTKDKPPAQNQAASVDSSSVASDESSGNSENSLPRIIKPRKRRKKDRKPLTQAPPSESNHQEDQLVEKAFLPPRLNEIKDTSKDLREHSLLDDKEDLIVFDEFPFGLLDDEEDSSELSNSSTVCQCRYCDPSGVIWDVDQRCYSPFLTPPSPVSTSLPMNFYINPDLGSLLRRSWSDPASNVKPDPPTPNSEPERRPCSPLGLQVSSEIVTSPNGHRDIEIKFYSSGSGRNEE